MKNLYKTTLLLLLVALGYNATAQIDAPTDTSYWKKGGTGNLTFSNVSLTNWAAGGDNSISLNAYLGLFANYAKERSTWENNLDLGYGLLKQGDADFAKSDDKISLTAKYGYKLSEYGNWYASALLDFKSQFAEGLDESDSIISKFLAPGYLLVAAGIDYKIGEVFSASLYPVTGKFTFVTEETLSNVGAYGVDPGSQARAELGTLLRLRYINEIIKNVNYETRLELFSNYMEDFGIIDVNWENILIMKINKYLSASLITQLIYDKDIKIGSDTNGDGVIDEENAKVQFKSVFGAGVAYTFGYKR